MVRESFLEMDFETEKVILVMEYLAGGSCLDLVSLQLHRDTAESEGLTEKMIVESWKLFRTGSCDRVSRVIAWIGLFTF